MAPTISSTSYAELPTPVARLMLQAAKTRDAKKRYDYVLAAWDATFRVSVAADPPADVSTLSEPSLGHWRAALKLPNVRLTAPELLELHRFLCRSLGREVPSGKRSISAQELIEPFPQSRNKLTTAHASPRPDEFYVEAVQHLAAALPVAWREGLFLPSGAQLVYLPDIQVDSKGTHRARVFLLQGPAIIVEAEGAEVPKGLLPEQVYLRTKAGAFRSLHPWVVYRPHEIRERLYLFNSSHRGLEFLDCDSGELLGEEALSEHGLEVDDPTRPPPEARASAQTPLPLPGEQPPARRAQPRDDEPSTYRSAGDRKTPSPAAVRSRWRTMGVRLAAAALLAPLGWLAARHATGGLAVSDWGFQDSEGGAGWKRRCQAHLDSGSPSAADAACSKGLSLPGGSDELRSELLRLRAAALEQQGDTQGVLDLLAEAVLLKRSDELDATITRLCSAQPTPVGEAAYARGVKLALPTGPDGQRSWTMRANSAETEAPIVTSPHARCVAVGDPRPMVSVTGGSIWYRVATRHEGATKTGWFAAPQLAPADPAADWLRRCRQHFDGGMMGEAVLTCTTGLTSPKLDVSTRASLERTLGLVRAQLGQSEQALEMLVSSYQTRRDEVVARELDSLCASLGQPPRPPGDARRYRVVSWASGDRSGNLRTEPSLTSPTTRILASLKRPSCVLTGEPQERKTPEGLKERWFPAEAMIGDRPASGWMHEVVLDPK